MWDNLDAVKQTVDALEKRLIKSEQRMASKEEAAALMAVSVKEGQQKSRFPGKKKNESRDQSDGVSNQEQGNTIHCYFCNSSGHMIRRCRNRKRKANARGAGNSGNIAEQPVMLVASIEVNNDE